MYSPSNQAKRKQTLLVVENEIIIADDIATLATKQGYTVLEPVFDYAAAVNAFQTYSPDLIILDIKLMGHLTGIEFGHWVRLNYNTPIIYLTAMGNQKTQALAISTQPAAYLLKPFGNQELLSAIRKALSK